MLEFTKNHKYFNQLAMVCKSVSKENTRYSLAHVEVNEKHIVATDGRRMACLDNFGIEVGRYKAMKVTKSIIVLVPIETDGGNYPKYTDILPETIREDEKETMPDWHKVCLISAVMFAISSKGACIRIEHLTDYLSATHFHVGESDRPVSFYADKFVAVAMPFESGIF